VLQHLLCSQEVQTLRVLQQVALMKKGPTVPSLIQHRHRTARITVGHSPFPAAMTKCAVQSHESLFFFSILSNLFFQEEEILIVYLLR
jgi:hypothetical protein